MTIQEKCDRILEAFAFRQTGGPAVIAIDGRCASGKTTLAEELARRTGAALVHADDFFLRPGQRTEQRYREPGGNMDRERLEEEVLIPFKKNGIAEYRPFNCQTFTLREPVSTGVRDLLIVEGSYCLHPDLRKYYDYSVFMDIDPATQLERLRKRNPEKMMMFTGQWIPLEEYYFRAMDPASFADQVFFNGRLTTQSEGE